MKRCKATLLFNAILACALLAGCGSSGSGTKGNEFQSPPKQALAITTTSLADATVGQTYSAHLQASGGSGTWSWKLTSGALPAGLSLSATGDVTGTPTTVATSAFAVEVDDTAGASSTANLSIRVKGAIMPGNLADAVAGQIYTAQLTATGGTPPYTWGTQNFGATQLSLPDGLSLSSSGVVSGIPVKDGMQQLWITVSDSAVPPLMVNAAVPLTVKRPPLRITTSVLPSARVDVPYLAQLGVVGGGSSVTFTLSGGSLPPGLGLDQTGAISGNPSSAGNFTFKVHATDGTESADASVQMNVVSTAARAWMCRTSRNWA